MKATQPVSPLVPLPEQLQRWASHDPDRVLLHHVGRDWSYGEIFRNAQSVGSWLAESGVRPDDRVALGLPNGAEYVIAYFGIGLAGACAVTLEASQTGRELAYAVNHSTSTAAILSGVAHQRLVQSGEPTPSLRRVMITGPVTDEMAGGNTTSMAEVMHRAARRMSAALLDSAAQIIYTSGTTGRPKGVVLSHKNLAANTSSIIASLSLGKEDSAFAILPFSYSYGNSVMLTHVSRGGRIVIASDFVFWMDVLDVMQRQKATGFAGIPSSFAMLINRSDFLRRAWPDLRYLTCAGGALPLSLVERIRHELPHVALYLMYGQTEASARLACLPPEDLERKLGSAGRAIADVELTIRDDTGALVSVGETGEIVARGDNIMREYWNDPEATTRVLRPDGLHTGDLGRMDAEGYLFITGRKDDVIKSGGYRIGPQEIEDVVLEVEGVAEAGVTGVKDEVLGAVPVAFVVARTNDPSLANRIRSHLTAVLPRFKIPRDIHVVGALPRTPNGKLQRRKLLELIPASESPSSAGNVGS
jgi:long-chain acyl-CoA synthetase